MARIVTIGVHGRDAASFLEALGDAGVGLLLDVRQRRGMRGADHAWANARRLQDLLASAGIQYRHVTSLAPTTELRQLQYREDDRQGVGKRSRVELAPEYVRRYTLEVLDQVDLQVVSSHLPEGSATALLCVERSARACHRSLVARRLATRFGHDVEHLP